LTDHLTGNNKIRPPCDPGPAAWNALLPPTAPRQALSGLQSADVVIIGAGFAGLSAARRLSELDSSRSIIVLEASTIADGPSGRNSGFMIDVPHDLASENYGGNLERDRKETRLNRYGIDYALQVKRDNALSDEIINPCGKINGAVSERGNRHNQHYADYLDSLGEAYESLSTEQMKAVTGSDVYQSGIRTKGTTMIQPAAYIRGLAGDVEQRGVVLYENSQVLSLTRDGDSWQASTAEGSVKATAVILTVNGHLVDFGYCRQQLVHVFTYASMTRELSESECKRIGGESQWAITPADPLGTTVRRISGGAGSRLIVRNRVSYAASLQVPHHKVQAMGKSQDKALVYRFPWMADIPFEYRWGGRLCLSLNSVPVFGELEPNLFAACCQNGLGTAKGSAYGKLVAELLSGEASDLLDDELQHPAPQPLPFRRFGPLSSLGAGLTVKWREYLAGVEL